MNLDIIAQNMLNPPILFFLLGMLAVFLNQIYQFPQPLPKFFHFFFLLLLVYMVDMNYQKVD